MALTPEQIRALREKAGLNPDPAARTADQRIAEMRSRVQAKEVESATTGNQFTEASTVQTPQTFAQKARKVATGVIGGGVLAEGTGQAMVAPKLQRQLSEVEQRMSDTDLALVKRIKEKSERGEDTSRLEQAREQLLSDMKISRDVQEDFVQSLPSNKQIISSAARLAATATAGKVAGGAAKLTGTSKATTVVGGAVRGAGAGAITGGVQGAIHGAGIAGEQDKSTEELIKSGLLGAAGGAVVGGAVGAVVGGVTGGVRGRTLKKEQFAEQLVAPKETTKVKIEALKQGRLKDPTFFRQAEIRASEHTKKISEAVDDVVSPKATLGENIDAIRLKINTTDNGVRNYIENNRVPFNGNQLRSKLETGKDDLRLIFASDTNAEKTYNAVTDAFMDTVGKKDTAGLFAARQDFDQIPAIKKLLESEGLGENTRREIVRAVRRSANEYIAAQLPKGNPYKPLMLQQSYALEALENIAEKGATVIGKNGLQLLTNEYPLLKWIVGGAVGAAGVGVGGALIGSSN